MTALLAIIPGPKEPQHAEFAKILEPVVTDFQKCERGLLIKTQHREITVSCRLLAIVADLPAAKKMIGAVSHASNSFPCHHCPIKLADIQTGAAFNLNNLPESRWREQLNAAFEAESASADRRKEIAQTYGVNYSPLVKLLGFNHAWTAPANPMHNTFLGIARAWFAMIVNSRLFSLIGHDNFSAVFENAEYPIHLGRLPRRIIRQLARDTGGSREKRVGASLKADEWRRVMQLLPVALYMGLKEADDSISAVDPGNPSHTSRSGASQRLNDDNTPSLSRFRNPRRVYDTCILVCSALQIFHSRTISLQDAEAATEDLSLDGGQSDNQLAQCHALPPVCETLWAFLWLQYLGF